MSKNNFEETNIATKKKKKERKCTHLALFDLQSNNRAIRVIKSFPDGGADALASLACLKRERVLRRAAQK